jgi:hypothetical protein
MIHTYQKKKLPLSSKKRDTNVTGKWFITLMQSTVLPIQNGNDNSKGAYEMKSCQTLFWTFKTFPEWSIKKII